MAFKFIALAALVAVANAGIIAPSAPLAYAPIAKTVDEDFDPHPQYSYSYDVHDSLTGDAKSQQEVRDGDVVQGSYSLLEADGTRRIVDYTADSINGFNAVVRKEPATVAVKAVAPAASLAYAAPVAKLATSVVHAAPVAHAAPLAYAAPLAHAAPLAYAAPVAKLAAAPAFAYSAPIAKVAAAPFAYATPYATPYATSYAKVAAAPAFSYAAPAAYLH